jgi:hypothetical protein
MARGFLVFPRGEGPHRANGEPGQAIAELRANLLVMFTDAADE